MTTGRTWRYRALVWAMLTILVVVFFRAWIGSGLPASPRREAIAHFTFIWQAADYLRQGHLYVDWDGSFFAGYPWLRFLQPAVCYLVAVLSLLPGMSLALALKVFIIATYVLSAWVMSELVRAIVHRYAGEFAAWGAGLVAGTAYALFPFHLRLGIEIVSHAAFWAVLPLPFLVYERSVRPALDAAGSSPRLGLPASLFGATMALYVIVDIEHALIFAPYVGLYLLLREATVLGQRWLRVMWLLAVAVIIALGLTAFTVLPAIGELGSVGITARFGEGGTADEQFARDTGISVGALLAAAADRAGVKYRPTDLPYIVFGFFGANAWYLGLASAALGLLGLAQWRRSPVVAVGALLLLLAFAWAARAWLPVNPFRTIPFFGTLSGFRGMIHIAFFLCLLAGFGVAWLLTTARRLPAQIVLAVLTVTVLMIDRPRPTLSYVAEVVAVLGLLALSIALGESSARLPKSWRTSEVHISTARVGLMALLLLALVAIDYRTASAAVVSLPRYFERDELDAYAWLSQQGEGFRIWEFSDLYDDAEFLHTFSLAYNQAPRFGGYYDNGAPQAQWHLYKWAKPERGVRSSPEALRTALKVSSVRYVLVHQRIATYDEAMAMLRQIGFDRVAWQSPHVTVLEDTGWHPLAVVYSQAEVASGAIQQELGALPQAMLWNRVVLPDGAAVSLPPDARAGVQPAPAPRAAVVQREGPERVVVQADLAAPGILVLAESWHGNWQAAVDRQPVPIVRANVAFMGVRLDAGKHTVLYSYRRPLSWTLGWVITLLALAMVVVWPVQRIVSDARR